MLVQQQINDVLKTFEPITLNEMDSVKLMNRTDFKFIFNLRLLPEILNLTKASYKVLEINNERLFSYKTVYYDTADFDFFNDHVIGKLNRHKIRHRTYESTGVSYLEVKFKSNKKRTIKWRIKNEIKDCFDNKASEFLLSRTSIETSKLNAVMTNFFKRITLVSIEDKTRITLDFDLSFLGNNSHKHEIPYLAIAEIKQEGNTNSNEFTRILKDYGIRQSVFSKYCIGSALIYDNLRKNSLKPNFLLLKRIQQEYDSSSVSY